MTRVLLVDDQELVRSGFRIILESEPGFEVVGEAANGVEAVARAAETNPDVICMDVEMPEMDGIEASRRILGGVAAAGHRPAILILTTFGHKRYLFDALAAGVSGFLLKTSRAEQLIDAIETLASGQALLGSDVTRVVIDRIARDRAPASGEDYGGGATSARPSERGEHAEVSATLESIGLTDREKDVLQHLAVGRSNGEIASLLFLGESTVKTHVSNLLQKLGVRDRIQAVVWAHTNNVVAPVSSE